MQLDTQTVVQLISIATPIVTGVALLIRLDMTSKSQTAQHEALGKRFDALSVTVAAISGDSREHDAHLDALDSRLDRTEKDIDWLRRGMGVGVK